MQWRLEHKGAGSRVVRLRIDHSWMSVMTVPAMLRAKPSSKTMAPSMSDFNLTRVLFYRGNHGRLFSTESAECSQSTHLGSQW